jgi:DNA-binding transcriptional ArsR family regulator
MEIGMTTPSENKGFTELATRAGDAARLLKLLANERRLLVLCHLAAAGEMNVTDLGNLVGLSQSALSQHLALMRDDGLVECRRVGVTMLYRIADPIAESLMTTLKNLYCPPRQRNH